MSDLDSAVGRLDNIFMSLYVVIAVLIIAVVLVCCCLSSHGFLLIRIIPGCPIFHSPHFCWNIDPWCASIFIDSHSSSWHWLPRTELAYWWLFNRSSDFDNISVHQGKAWPAHLNHFCVLTFLFFFPQHPYDVGDRIVVAEVDYTVKEISLLSTCLLDGNNALVQAPNSVLNGEVCLPYFQLNL